MKINMYVISIMFILAVSINYVQGADDTTPLDRELYDTICSYPASVPRSRPGRFLEDKIANVTRLLLDGANPNFQDEEGWTPLHVLSSQSSDAHNEIYELLLENTAHPENKANPNIIDREGCTPLKMVLELESFHIKGVVLLLSHGAELPAFIHGKPFTAHVLLNKALANIKESGRTHTWLSYSQQNDLGELMILLAQRSTTHRDFEHSILNDIIENIPYIYRFPGEQETFLRQLLVSKVDIKDLYTHESKSCIYPKNVQLLLDKTFIEAQVRAGVPYPEIQKYLNPRFGPEEEPYDMSLQEIIKAEVAFHEKDSDAARLQCYLVIYTDLPTAFHLCVGYCFSNCLQFILELGFETRSAISLGGNIIAGISNTEKTGELLLEKGILLSDSVHSIAKLVNSIVFNKKHTQKTLNAEQKNDLQRLYSHIRSEKYFRETDLKQIRDWIDFRIQEIEDRKKKRSVRDGDLDRLGRLQGCKEIIDPDDWILSPAAWAPRDA